MQIGDRSLLQNPYTTILPLSYSTGGSEGTRSDGLGHMVGWLLKVGALAAGAAAGAGEPFSVMEHKSA
jgi:hypothetical protein